MKSFITKALATISLAVVALPATLPYYAKAESPTLTVEEISANKYEVEIEAWLSKLARCESGGNPKQATLMDSDGTPSLGMYQFKVGTWLAYNKKYDVFPNDAVDRSVARIFSTEDSTRMTRTIVENEPKGWRNWTNCTKKIGLPPER